MMTSISFDSGYRSRVIKSGVGKLKTRVDKLKQNSALCGVSHALCAEFSPKMFANPGLKLCRRP